MLEWYHYGMTETIPDAGRPSRAARGSSRTDFIPIHRFPPTMIKAAAACPLQRKLDLILQQVLVGLDQGEHGGVDMV
jgi:hypothetical protein